jgi:hypothetical protein
MSESFTTIELKINFFRPVWVAQLRAEGKIVRRGSSIGGIERDITDEEGRLIAKASSSCMALRSDRAAVPRCAGRVLYQNRTRMRCFHSLRLSLERRGDSPNY